MQIDAIYWVIIRKATELENQIWTPFQYEKVWIQTKFSTAIFKWYEVDQKHIL